MFWNQHLVIHTASHTLVVEVSTWTEVSRCWNGASFEPVNPHTVNIERSWVQGEQQQTDNNFMTHC